MLHLRRYHKGIVHAYKISQPSILHLSFSSTTKKTKPVKEYKLSDDAPTPFPPINPKIEDYEAQKGPQRESQSQKQTSSRINIWALFLGAGVLCGGIISIYQPKDFRNEFKFFSPLPDVKYTKLSRDEPVNIQETLDIKNNVQQDQASALSYSLFLGFTGGIMGSLWYKNWTHPLRIKSYTLFELNETLTELRAHSLRNCIKGTLLGSLGVLGFIYGTVFFGYLYLGQFFGNKYADKSFWKYMELMYQKNIESRRSYEMTLELQEHLKQQSAIQTPITPSITGEKESAEISDKRDDEQRKVIAEEQKRKHDLYKKTIKGMEWNTDLYLNTKELPYYKLTDDAKAVRWNMAREMATLAMSCALYIVVPVYFGASVFATRTYAKFWKQLSLEMVKTKTIPRHVY